MISEQFQWDSFSNTNLQIGQAQTKYMVIWNKDFDPIPNILFTSLSRSILLPYLAGQRVEAMSGSSQDLCYWNPVYVC